MNKLFSFAIIMTFLIGNALSINTYEIFESSNDYPRPLLLQDNNVLAFSGLKGGYMVKYNPNGEIILPRRQLFEYDSNANFAQLKGSKNIYYVLISGFNKKFTIVLFDDTHNISIQTTNYVANSYSINVTPLQNGNALVGWEEGKTIKLQIFKLENNQLVETSERTNWGTSNHYISCIEMPSNNAFICNYILGNCVEKYKVLTSQLNQGIEYELVNNNSGCGFDKIINLDGDRFAICYLRHSDLNCFIGMHANHQVTPKVAIIKIMTSCEVNAIKVDLSYFGDDKFITACVKNNKIQLGIVSYTETNMTTRIVECTGQNANYPHTSKFSDKFISVFYNINNLDKENVFEIIDYSNCEGELVPVYINKDNTFSLSGKIIKGSGTVTSSILKLRILELPTNGIVKKTSDNSEIRQNDEYPESNIPQMKYFATSNSGNFSLKFAGVTFDVIEGDKVGKFCSYTWNVKSCWIGCYTCNSDDWTADNNKCEGCATGYHPLIDKSNSCDKDPDYYYLKDNLDGTKTYNKCWPTCKTCTSGGTINDHECKKCKIDHYPFEDKPQCANTPPEGYYLNQTDENSKVYKKCYQTCKTCSGDGSLASNNCIDCTNGNYKFEGLNGQCADSTDLPYYLDSDNVFKPCHSTCSKCSKKGNATKNNCDSCSTGNYPISDQTGQCVSTKPDHYYLDETDPINKIYKPCDVSCNTCNGELATNCLTCTPGYYLVSDIRGVCLNTPPEHYYLNDDDPNNKIYKPCYSTCQTCSADGNIDSNNCDSCKTGNYEVEGKNKSCSAIRPPGYYLDELSSPKVYKKCYVTCKECSEEGNINNNNCDSCATNHYPISDQNKCTNTKPPQYYFNTTTEKYEPCYPSCENCNSVGTSTDHLCTKCLTGFFPKDDKASDCSQGVIDDYYFDTDKYYPCIPNCKTCFKGTGSASQCSVCKDGFNGIFNENKCVNIPPDHHYLDKTDQNPDNWVYKKCDITCNTCDGGNKNNCLTCITDHFPVKDQIGICVNKNTPPDNHYLGKDNTNNDIFKPCDSTCKTCNGDTKKDCINCEDGLYKVLGGGNECVGTQPPNHYLNQDDPLNPIYKPCWPTCKTCSGDGNAVTNQCDTCKDTYFPIEGIPTTCTDTPPPYYFKNETVQEYQKCYINCLTCDAKEVNSSNNCLTCKPGLIISNKNCASSCTTGTYFWENACVTTCPQYTVIKGSTCYNCKESNEYVFETGTTCVAKPNNTYIKDNNFNVIAYCDASCLTCETTDTHCLSCQTGNILHNNQCISQCPVNLFEYQGVCTTCPNTLYADPISKKCVNCKALTPPQYKDINIHSCQSTQPEGTIIIDPNFNAYDQCYTNCKTCSAVSADSSHQKCLTCKSGFYKEINKDNCLSDCGQNLVSDATLNECVNCQTTNEYKYLNQNQCQAKPSNTYVIDPIYNTIDDCHANCRTCNAAPVDVNNQKCLSCPNGKFLDYKTTNCINQCDSKYSPDRVNNKCINCKDGNAFKYLDEDDCISPKPPNSYLLESPNIYNTIGKCYPNCATCSGAGISINDQNCITCIPGTYPQPGTNDCIGSCPPGLLEDLLNSKCINCKTDYTPPRYKIEGLTQCVEDLPDNSYVIDDSSNYYGLCEPKCKTCTDDTSCDSCSNGYFLEINNPSCVSTCGNNLVSDSTDNKCVNCKDNGEYKYLVNNECVTRPPKTYIIDQVFSTIGNCHEKCKTCSGAGTDENNNCDTCEDLTFKYYNSKNCVTDCGKELVADIANKKCINCADKTPPEFKYENSNQCIANRPNNSYIIDNTFNTIGTCHPRCATCNVGGTTITSQGCSICSAPFYLEYGATNCIEKCGSDYGQNSTTKKCEKCSENTDGNIVKYPDDTECRPKPPGTAIVDPDLGIIDNCYPTCNSCTLIGDATNNKCDTCFPNQYLIEGTTNCVTSCPNYLYQDTTLKKCINCKTIPGGPKYKYPGVNQCVNRDPNTYIIDEAYNTIGDCYSTCETCSNGGTLGDNKCDSCAANTVPHPLVPKQCVIECDLTLEKWYLDQDSIYLCTGTANCPGDHAILEPNTKQCVDSCSPRSLCVECKSENLYEWNNECVNTCPNEYLPNNSNHKCLPVPGDGTCALNKIPADATVNLNNLKDNLDSYLQEYIRKYTKDTIVDIITNSEFSIQIFKSDKCHNESSTINSLIYGNMTDCQEILQKEYTKASIYDIIFVKVEVNRTSSSTNQVTTFAYDTLGTPLDMSKCKSTTYEYPIVFPQNINIQTANKLAQLGVDVFNPDDPFFNDFCYPFYTEDGKDVVMIDRREDYFQNCTVCEKGCNYQKVDILKGTVTCECEPKNTTIDQINDILDNVPMNDFTKKINTNNLIVVTCYNLVFNWLYMKKNIGSWILICFFILQWPVVINFAFIGLRPIYAALNKMANEMFVSNVANPTKKNTHGPEIEDVSINTKSPSEEFGSPETPNILVANEHLPTKKLSIFDLHQQKRANYINIREGGTSDSYLTSTKTLKGKEDGRTKTKTDKSAKEEEEKIDFEDSELDDLVYEDACQYDTRGICKFFWRCLKIKLFILNPFSNISIFEPFCIRVIVFFLNLATFFVLNAILFDEDYISLRYDTTTTTGFLFLLQNEIPKSIYAGLASVVIGFVIGFLTSSRKRIETLIKKEKKKEEFLRKLKQILKSLQIRLIFFFILNFILMAGFWYYVSAFCAVYQSTQLPWVEGTLITILFCMILQIMYAFLLTIMRYMGLKCHISCFYSISKCLL